MAKPSEVLGNPIYYHHDVQGGTVTAAEMRKVWDALPKQQYEFAPLRAKEIKLTTEQVAELLETGRVTVRANGWDPGVTIVEENPLPVPDVFGPWLEELKKRVLSPSPFFAQEYAQSPPSTQEE